MIFVPVPPLSTISAAISQATGARFSARRYRQMSGGSINRAYCIEGAQRYFVKLNDGDALVMFEAEVVGLRELARAATIRVPHAVCAGLAGDSSFIVMEYLELQDRGDMAEFGSKLASLHRWQAPDFGWHMNNTLGTTPQINARSKDWCEFWRAHRLGYQLELAARNGHHCALLSKGDRLMACFDGLFSDYRPEPALLHGDLWFGNYAMDASGQPVVFDPAVYHGDRETDLAMTELFGGFGEEFYRAYNDAYPLDEGYRVRKVFYNLYHVLNHAHLFGGAYFAQAERMMDFVLGELGG